MRRSTFAIGRDSIGRREIGLLPSGAPALDAAGRARCRATAGLTTDERPRLKQLERENFELKRANDILRKSFGVFRAGEARPPSEMTLAFIDQDRAAYGVTTICGVLPIAPSTHLRHEALERDSARRSRRARDDEQLRTIIRRIWSESPGVWTAQGMTAKMGRENLRVARCRVRR